MAITVVRKRSPRAPLISLKEAVDRADKVYEKEGRHAATADIVAEHLGYKSADNGAAKQTIATLGYYGLLERPAEGMLAVTKSLEEYKFEPSEKVRTEILRKWLVTPGVFGELLEKFPGRLPSDASLKQELIRKGFKQAVADEYLAAFLESVKFVSQAEGAVPALKSTEPEDHKTAPVMVGSSVDAVADQNMSETTTRRSGPGLRTTPIGTRDTLVDEDSDRIPVRLAGGRRAWLVIPSPFYEADKRRLISQIELLLTNDDE
ncbi:MAG: hypothetical protein ACYC39_13025 [Thiobacillus sp.]|nr:hypothetical protein [Thiobacillus sp.]